MIFNMSDADLLSNLKRIKGKRRVPALAAAAHIDGELLESAAFGKRKIGHDAIVGINDKWHVGSCTKAMTSTLAGVLVERQKIKWTTKISEVLEDWDVHMGWHSATLEQLLTHHGGAPHSMDPALWERIGLERTGTLTPLEQRVAMIQNMLKCPPTYAPGSKFLYSNSGYAIAGHMLEVCTGLPWETLLVEHVFRPLEMTSAGFGAPGTSGPIEHPYGHARYQGSLIPIVPGPLADNPAAIAPGVSVHCSIQDLAKFAASHAGTQALVSEDTLHRLHRRYGATEYSPGWYVVSRSWGKGYVLCHSGTNTYWFAMMWIAPMRKAAFVAVSNSPEVAGKSVCDHTVVNMIDRLL